MFTFRSHKLSRTTLKQSAKISIDERHKWEFVASRTPSDFRISDKFLKDLLQVLNTLDEGMPAQDVLSTFEDDLRDSQECEDEMRHGYEDEMRHDFEGEMRREYEGYY